MTRLLLVQLEGDTTHALERAEQAIWDAVRWKPDVAITVSHSDRVGPDTVQQTAEAILTCACGDRGCPFCQALARQVRLAC